MDPSQLNSESTYGMGEHAHAILRSFRACWNDGRKVRAEGFADQCPDEERNGLIIALLQVEIEARQQRGEVVELQELDSRFPHLKAEIHRWLTQFIGSKDRANSSTMMGDGVPQGQASELTGFDTGITSGVTQLGRYILKEAIGRGAFGEVWLAEDPKLHRDVAVKVPRLGMALSPQIRQQFVAEGRKAAQLHHPNIVSVYDAGEADGRCYIVSQYVSGGNLRDIIRQGPLDVEKALDIAVKVSEALHYAHEKRIVHRDIKPANILLTDRDQPLITDFGLAKFEAADQSILVPGELAGTPAYMAPEQALQGAHNVDCRADIFSLGIIISEMLTGVRPQVGSSPQEWQAQHQRGLQIIAPSTVRNDVPAEVDHVISRATSRDLATRYTSAQELADDLKIIQRRLSGESIELSTVLAPAIPVVPRRWVLSGGLILGIAVIVGMVSHSVSQVPEPDDGRITVKILTSPEGAEVTFIPLETDTGYPRPDEAVKSQILEEPAGSETRDLADLSSANREITNQQADEIAQQNGTQKVSTARLFPGRYLVVTVWDKDSFHEVYRTVPARDQTSTGGPYSHMFFRKQLDGVVRLPEIVLAQPPDEFQRLTKTIEETQLSIDAPPGKCSFLLPEFKITKKPVSLAHTKIFGMAFNRTGNQPWVAPPSLLKNNVLLKKILAEDGPLVGVSWDQAIFLAERIGMRLPDELECRAFYESMENSDDAREPPRENEIVESVWTTGAATSRPGPQCYDNSAPKSVVSSKTERVVLGERHLEPGHLSAKMPPQSETVARRFVDRRDASDLTIGLRLVSIDKARLTATDFPRLIQQESN